MHMFDTQSLSNGERLALLARLAHELTICARDTYEAGTDGVLEPEVLRAYNELLHRVTVAVVQHQSGADGFSVETIIEMARSFGEKHSRIREIDCVLHRAFHPSGGA